MKRKVTVFEWKKLDGDTYHSKINAGVGLFHQFGCDYEPFENGAASFSTAIVEMQDGSVRNVPVEMIEFIECAYEADGSAIVCQNCGKAEATMETSEGEYVCGICWNASRSL